MDNTRLRKASITVFLVFAVFLLTLTFLGVSFAQQPNYVYGTIRTSDGFYVYTKVTPLQTFSDRFFSYWIGEAHGDYYIFDPYRQIWYQGPVQYLRTSLSFRGARVEGFLRVWGIENPYVDPSYFFGVDGAIYKNVREYKRIGPKGKRHKRLRRSYYVNSYTGERSDMPPRTPEEESAYKQLLIQLSKDAFPSWAEPISPDEPPPSTEEITGDEAEDQELTDEISVVAPAGDATSPSTGPSASEEKQ